MRMQRLRRALRQFFNMMRCLWFNAPIRWHEMRHRTTLIDVINLEFERRK